jgi:flagellar hook assembly protein FlgD
MAFVLHLYPPSPNPSSTGTFICYYVSADATMDIKIYNVSGEKVRDLDPFPAQGGKNNETFWDGKSSADMPVASGVYLFKVAGTSLRDEKAQGFGKCAVLR